MLTQINRLEQTAGKGDKKQQEPCSRVFHFIADTQQGETRVLIVIGRGKQSICVGDFVDYSRVKNTLETAFRFL